MWIREFIYVLFLSCSTSTTGTTNHPMANQDVALIASYAVPGGAGSRNHPRCRSSFMRQAPSWCTRCISFTTYFTTSFAGGN